MVYCLKSTARAWRRIPGTARLARNVLALVFAVAVGKALAASLRGPLWWPAPTTAELERNLRAVQAFAILGLVILLVAYSIPLGRNLRGIVLGYALVHRHQPRQSWLRWRLPEMSSSACGLIRNSCFTYLYFAFGPCHYGHHRHKPEVPWGAEPPTPYEDAERKTRERWKRIRIFFGRTKIRIARE